MTAVLVLEDDAVYGPALCRALGRSGMDATLATTVEDAIARAEAAPPPLAVVDLKLPDGSGVDAVRALVARGTRVVVLTGHGSIPAAVECMRVGAADFLTKPVSTDELKAALEAALAGASGPSPSEPPADDGVPATLDEVERNHILGVLRECDGNISEAARRLGLYRRTLQRKLQKLG